MDIFTERILHAERKQKEKNNSDSSAEKAMTTPPPKCYQCGKFGRIKKYCRNSPTQGEDKRKYRDFKEKANAAEAKHTECSSNSENIGLVVRHAMPSLSGKAAWIVDSGATSHVCNNQSFSRD